MPNVSSQGTTTRKATPRQQHHSGKNDYFLLRKTIPLHFFDPTKHLNHDTHPRHFYRRRLLGLLRRITAARKYKEALFDKCQESGVIKNRNHKKQYIFNVSTGPREGLSSGISLLVGSGLSEVGWTTYRRELDSVPKLNDEIAYEKD
jgi:hypothetical protein